MTKGVPIPVTKVLVEELHPIASSVQYVLRLFVTGSTPRSIRAIYNVRKICEEHLQDRYDLEVVDISQYPMLAQGEQIIAAPTLIKKLPLPLRRFIGDMSETQRILVGLDLRHEGETAPFAEKP